MNIELIIIYLISSIILFLILNYIEKKDNNNYINYIIISILYIILLAGILSTLNIDNKNNNIYLIIIFEFLIRLFYHNYILENNILKENKFIIKIYGISITLSYLITNIFIKKVENVFPTEHEIKIIIWLLIPIYIYIYLKQNITIKKTKKTSKEYYQNKDYIVTNYAKFKNKYYDIITTKSKQIKYIIYSIMIYENYYKPELLRKLDIIKYRIDNKPRKFGIMQILSKHIITDEESIELSIKKLEKIHSKLTTNSKTIITDILKKYYDSKTPIEQIENIYNEIRIFDNKQ